MNVLKINIPEGYEIDTFNKETGEVSFKQTHSTITPEEMFLEIFDGCTVRFDKKTYPDKIFYFDKENFLAEYDSKNNVFWVNFYKVWEVFETTFSLSYQPTQELLNSLMEEHFKLRGDTMYRRSYPHHILMEEHFKSK